MQRTHVPRAVALPDGRILSFAMFGDPGGRPIVALHGAVRSHTIWALADGAARRCDVCLIAPDRPGYGASTPLPGRRVVDGPPDLLILAEAVFLEELRLVTVGGGAEHGLSAAHCLRPRVRRLALVAPDEPAPRAPKVSGPEVADEARLRAFAWQRPAPPPPCRTKVWDGSPDALLAALDPVLEWLGRP